MKGYRRRQQGAILVLTAFLLPFIIAFTGMAVDFGSAYVRRLQLQNAADAAALAGAYHLDDNKADNVVLQYLQTNLDPHFKNYSYQTGDDFPNEYETLNYHTDKKEDELDVTLRSNVETSFLKLFDIDAIPVSATAKAKISSDTINVNDDMFNYALTASEIPPTSYDPSPYASFNEDPRKSANPYSIYFHTPNVKIYGNLLTNGKIVFDNSRNTLLSGTLYAASTVKNGKTIIIPNDSFGYLYRKKFIPDVWGRYSWTNKSSLSDFIETINDPVLRYLLRLFQRIFGSRDMVEYYTFISSEKPFNFTDEDYSYDETGLYYYDKTETGTNKVDYTNHSTPVDILPENNPGIKSLLEKYAKIYKTNPEELKKNHVFYDVNPATTYYPLSVDDSTRFPGFITDWNNKDYYNIVVVNNSIKINDYKGTPSDDEYAIIISLNGDITYTGQHPFNGILYAPNGMVLIKGDGNTKFTGSIVAQYILVTAPNQEIHWKNYFQNNSDISGTGDGKVKLIQ